MPACAAMMGVLSRGDVERVDRWMEGFLPLFDDRFISGSFPELISRCSSVRCYGRPSEIVTHRRADGGITKTMLICSDCREPWNGQPVPFRYDIQRRVDRANNVLVERLSKQQKFEDVVLVQPAHMTKTRWMFSVVCWLMYLHTVTGTYESIVQQGPVSYPEWKRLFTLGRVRRAVRAARMVVLGRLS